MITKKNRTIIRSSKHIAIQTSNDKYIYVFSCYSIINYKNQPDLAISMSNCSRSAPLFQTSEYFNVIDRYRYWICLFAQCLYYTLSAILNICVN